MNNEKLAKIVSMIERISAAPRCRTMRGHAQNLAIEDLIKARAQPIVSENRESGGIAQKNNEGNHR